MTLATQELNELKLHLKQRQKNGPFPLPPVMYEKNPQAGFMVNKFELQHICDISLW